jgi:peptidyl-tRNA hydrolase, PTH2 family
MSEDERTAKQVIVIRRDLGMRRGKEIAQGAHASMAWLAERVRGESAQFVSLSPPERAWVNGSFTKVVCQAGSLGELEELYGKARSLGLLHYLITDAGRTEFGGVETVTALAIGPGWSDQVDQVTSELALY